MLFEEDELVVSLEDATTGSRIQISYSPLGFGGTYAVINPKEDIWQKNEPSTHNQALIPPSGEAAWSSSGHFPSIPGTTPVPTPSGNWLWVFSLSSGMMSIAEMCKRKPSLYSRFNIN